jgi:hypothetical protein
LQQTLGESRAPYFGPSLEYPREGRGIWEGWRGIEEYAREVFPIEEYANGMRWMEEDGGSGHATGWTTPSEMDEGENGRSRPITPAGIQGSLPLHMGAYTPKSHPEGGQGNFFVGSC